MKSFPCVKLCLNTSEENLVKELYEPCLKWAERYDRGIGYFTTGWLAYNIAGMGDFASRGGKMRLITSPIISDDDYAAIVNSTNESEKYNVFYSALEKSVEELSVAMESDILNAFSWMLFDNIVDLKFAIPTNKLDGNFHDKFGIFYKDEDSLSFTGSINDSKQGISNYESIKVFKTWTGTEEYVYSDIERFNRIWNGNDRNLKMFTIPNAIKERIFVLRNNTRPYKKTMYTNKWTHQDIAMSTFLEKKNGILAMATGTGKTFTAIRIMKELFEQRRINRVIITMYGNDLLAQWQKQLLDFFKHDKIIYKNYGKEKQMQDFLTLPDDAILLLSREANNLDLLINKMLKIPGNLCNDTLWIFDEVHGAGSNSLVKNLKGKISLYIYRLGLSATPEREYDEEGNDFIETEIGPIIFTFSLQDAISAGILCEFDYIPLDYELTDDERRKKKTIIANFNARKKNGESVKEKDMYQQLAMVNKTAEQKLVEFKKLITSSPNLLKRCIIFVETKEYGLALQKILMAFCDDFHTYYAEDNEKELHSFAKGEIDCLITCKKLSEGIDIKSVENIVLFSSDRSKLETTQRIGRALRIDNNYPDKRAKVIDFVLTTEDSDKETADTLRKEWLIELSNIRRKNHAE